MESLMIKKQSYNLHPHSTTPSPLAIHRDSQMISKAKPKIRIIHIFAPEIIKTDVENFRELVQRLTGKPTEDRHHHHHQKGFRSKKPRTTDFNGEKRSNSRDVNIVDGINAHGNKQPAGNTRREFIKEEEEEEGEGEDQIMWTGLNMGTDQNNNSSPDTGGCDGGGDGGLFLNGFASDIDGFIQELGEFPLLNPMSNYVPNSHNLHAFEDATHQFVHN